MSKRIVWQVLSLEEAAALDRILAYRFHDLNAMAYLRMHIRPKLFHTCSASPASVLEVLDTATICGYFELKGRVELVGFFDGVVGIIKDTCVDVERRNEEPDLNK